MDELSPRITAACRFDTQAHEYAPSAMIRVRIACRYGQSGRSECGADVPMFIPEHTSAPRFTVK